LNFPELALKRYCRNTNIKKKRQTDIEIEREQTIYYLQVSRIFWNLYNLHKLLIENLKLYIIKVKISYITDNYMKYEIEQFNVT